MEIKRPTLQDPKEWEIVRSMYFGGIPSVKPVDVEDTIERLDRMERRRVVTPV